MNGVAQQAIVREPHQMSHESLKQVKCEALSRVIVAWQSDCVGVEQDVTSLFPESDFMQDVLQDTKITGDGTCTESNVSYPELHWGASVAERTPTREIFHTKCTICVSCFPLCNILCRATFGSASCLEQTSISFLECTDVSIPNGVHELGDECFKGRKSLCRVTLGCCSSLKRIGVSCFEDTQVREVHVLRELLLGKVVSQTMFVSYVIGVFMGA